MSCKAHEKILVVTNGLQSTAPTHETGLNLAKRYQSKVILVDTVQPPGAFAKWLSSNSTDVFEMVLADKQERLVKYAAVFENAGIETETKVLFGKSSEAIIVEAIESEVSLVVRYAKGSNSKFTGDVGNTARALLRYCPVPVLLVDKQPIDNPRVMACLDAQHDIKENNAIIAESSLIAQNRDDLFGLYCWEMYGADMMKKRMHPNSFDESVDRTRNLYKNIYDRMLDEIDTELLDTANIEMVRGEPSLIIPTCCTERNIDVLTMCTATLHHPIRRYFGSTVEAILEKLPCALLAVKPEGFVSPISEKSNAEATL